MAIRAAWALILANLRYWSQLAPRLRGQIRHWEQRATEIEDPERCALALQKLRREGFNAEAGAMMATLAPAPHRRAAAQAILTLELMFDYLDGLTERPLADPLADGEALYGAFLSAFDPNAREAEDPYLAELATCARAAIAELPAWAQVAPLARQCAQRAAQAQVRMHAAARLGEAQLQQWARSQVRGTALPWRDFLAGSACAVLALHALIAAAGDRRTTPQRAEQIAAAYGPICAAMTLLDGLIDGERDATAGQRSYAGLYESPESLAAALLRSIAASRRAFAPLPNGAHHAMVLSAAIAYWLSEPGAQSSAAAPIVAQLRSDLGPLLPAPLALMRTWRATRRLRGQAARIGKPLRANRDSESLRVSVERERGK
jgi:tetraprenyl-beta-curcumene synthase